MIYWLGYDAPEVPLAEAPNLGIAGTGRADEAAPHLRDFTHGLRASHEGPERANLTVLGHSYGSSVVGDADSGGDGLDADRISVVGSPGVTVGKASDLHVAPTTSTQDSLTTTASVWRKTSRLALTPTNTGSVYALRHRH